MSARKATRTKLPTAQETARATNVLLESLERQMKAVLEAVNTNGSTLRTEIRELEARLSARITVLEEVVREHSRSLREQSEEIRALRRDLNAFRHDFDHREEVPRLKALEARVAIVEQRLGVVPRR
jgi:predicted phage tail protein